ncbi:hypothetical protein [Collimonas pratensis]|uniref:Uncharacterized protein n=1 Tax=Collimonas pratensis TaxID=279113 RepID=A0A127QCS9_9BURK|nr:hypothetical protein [Collimonas pratensis]AMP07655.1 hypothetical protein CPter91_5369 [Collimonas pratensis]
MKIVQITPAVDWYFKHDSTVWNIAAFGLTEEGEKSEARPLFGMVQIRTAAQLVL